MLGPYAEQWPKLAEVTNNLDPGLLLALANNIDQYSVDVQVEYHSYLSFQQEYEDWLDSCSTPNYFFDY